MSIAANGLATGGRGGLAQGGSAVIDVSGTSALAAARLGITANGVTRESQASSGGTASLVIRPGSAANVTAADLLLDATGSGADPQLLTNAAGQFVVDVQGAISPSGGWQPRRWATGWPGMRLPRNWWQRAGTST